MIDTNNMNVLKLEGIKHRHGVPLWLHVIKTNYLINGYDTYGLIFVDFDLNIIKNFFSLKIFILVTFI